jgi:hypothetical protein
MVPEKWRRREDSNPQGANATVFGTVPLPITVYASNMAEGARIEPARPESQPTV